MIVFFSTSKSFTYSAGSPSGYSGSPGDDFKSCVSCHGVSSTEDLLPYSVSITTDIGEYYVPGNSISRGYVKSYNEKVSVPCNSNGTISNHSHYETKPKTSYTIYKPAPKCNGSATLGGLIGGGLAASLTKPDAYGWTIPLGAVLGAGIENAECK